MAPIRQYMDVAVLVLGLSCFPAFVGCNGLSLPGKPPPPPESKPAEIPAISNEDRAVFSCVQEKDPQGREQCVWVHSVEADSPFRWRYPKMEAVLAQPVDQRPNLLTLLEDRDKNVAFNAAIALGRAGDARAIVPLSKAVRTTTLPLVMRLAAAEALGSAGATPASKNDKGLGEIRKLLDQYGDYSPKKPPTYISELHEELLYGLARHVDAAEDPRFVSALKSPRAEVRLAAIKAWTTTKSGKLPPEALDLRTDGDPRVRAAALTALVAQRHPQSLEYLRQSLYDTVFSVRRAAIVGLGNFGGAEAAAILEEQYKDRSDGVRAEVVVAFTAMKSKRHLLEAASDKSWRVRLKAAEAMSLFPDDAGAAAMDKFLEDPSVEVQSAAIHALEKWPLDRSGPILLEAMEKSSYSTRKTAAEQLADHWRPAGKFVADAPAERRAKVLQELQLQFRNRHAVVQTSGSEAIVSRTNNRKSASPQAIAEVESMIANKNALAMIDYGQKSIDALEVLRFEQKQMLPLWVYQDVLPKMRPEFIALDLFTSKDATSRRVAAREFQACVARQSCCPLAVDRLLQLMQTETDDLVWLRVLQAISNESGEEAAAIACAGLSQSSSEVRRQACVYMAAHPDRRHVPWLLPALEDKQPLVICAAIEALAAGGMDDPAPLKPLLNSTSEEIQLAVAIALVRLNDAGGKPALERLAYSKDSQIRAQVARALGEYPDPEFIPILIRYLSDQAAIARAALASLPKVVGEDISQPANHPQLPIAERISRWKHWFERQESSKQ